MFGISLFIAVAALGKGAVQLAAHDPAKPRDFYDWNETGIEGGALYRSMGCNNCHRAMGVGEIGIAPVLDGEGTRRTHDWLMAYLSDPGSVVAGSAHDGRLGPDFRRLAGEERRLLAAFLFGLKTNPGSPNYPRPPEPRR